MSGSSVALPTSITTNPSSALGPPTPREPVSPKRGSRGSGWRSPITGEPFPPPNQPPPGRPCTTSRPSSVSTASSAPVPPPQKPFSPPMPHTGSPSPYHVPPSSNRSDSSGTGPEKSTT